MKLFKNKRKEVYAAIDPAEERFDTMLKLIKELPRADYNRLKDAMDLGYNAYQKIKNVKTAEEREFSLDEINTIENSLDLEMKPQKREG